VRYIVYILLSFNLLQSAELIPLASKNIQWKEKITLDKIVMVETNKKYKCKQKLDIETLKQNRYRAKHFIKKRKVICGENVYKGKMKKVLFNFGAFEIEKEAEVVKETNDYIKIKNLDGKIDKIYKYEAGQ
jgi:hypothetical protein